MRATDEVKIGMTALRVSRLGLGGVALSGAPPATDPHQTTSEAEAVAIVQRSLALGLNYLDRIGFSFFQSQKSPCLKDERDG